MTEPGQLVACLTPNDLLVCSIFELPRFKPLIRKKERKKEKTAYSYTRKPEKGPHCHPIKSQKKPQTLQVVNLQIPALL